VFFATKEFVMPTVFLDRGEEESVPMKLLPIELQEGMQQVVSVQVDADGNDVYVLMAEMILNNIGRPRPSPRHRVHHKDGDYLNNQRDNLDWVIPDRLN
jgi:hypothetical protein